MTYFVPISLMVTMEMVKLFQGVVIGRDRTGFSEEYQCFTTANNTSVNENLGQIKYVFTDKTGTLTKNNMIFKNLICGGKLYGNKEEEGDGKQPEKKAGAVRQTVDFKDYNFEKDKASPRVQDALKVISLCHEIAVEMEDNKRNYNSSSPDEVALINFAKQEGKELLGEERRMIKIAERRDDGTSSVVQYEKLTILEFNSDRKRMSIIIRDPQSKRIELLCKGADSTVKALLRPGQADLEPTQRIVDDLSVKGLRTLMMGKKYLTEDEYNRWNKDLQESRSIIGEAKRDRIAECYERIERDLDLVGATAIEDELQD
jgi:magnesium-transporting ATPase (P-type)